MSQLRRSIQRLAEHFAESVLKALHSSTLADLTTLSATGGDVANGRTPTKTTAPPKTGAVTIDAIVTALKSKPAGMRNEHLQQALGVSKDALVKPIKTALASKAIKKKGERRGTTYFAA